MKTPHISTTRVTRGSGELVYAVPGILAHGPEQIELLGPVFHDNDVEVKAVDYHGEFDGNAYADILQDMVAEQLSRGREVTMLGISIGGMISVRAARALKQREGLHVIIGDSPFDRDDIKIGHMPQATNNTLARLAQHSHPDQVANRFAHKLHFSETQFAGWWQRVGWMLSQETTDTSGLTSDDMYIACMGKNDQVRQPQAANKYRDAVGSVVELTAEHCSIHRRPALWRWAINEALWRPDHI